MKYFDFYGLVMRRKLKIVTLELIYHVNLHYACKCNSVKHIIIIVVTMFLSLCKCVHPMWITEYHKSEHAYDVLMHGVTWRILFSIFTISAQTVAIDL